VRAGNETASSGRVGCVMTAHGAPPPPRPSVSVQGPRPDASNFLSSLFSVPTTNERPSGVCVRDVENMGEGREGGEIKN